VKLNHYSVCTCIAKRTNLLFFFLLSTSLSVTAHAAEILDAVINEPADKAIHQCVSRANNLADDGLDTATRLYETGMCYFCIDCDFKADNGQLFTVSEIDTLTLNENFNIAYKLISQSAGLGKTEAYYGLAVILYLEGLNKHKKSKISIAKIKTKSLESELQQSKFILNAHDEENIDQEKIKLKIANLIDKIYQNQQQGDFSLDIYKNVITAAKQGYIPAQFALSEIYFNGIGIAPNVVEAYAWAATAVAQNPPFGSLRRDEKAVNLTDFELSKADAIAEGYMKKYTTIFDRSSVTVMR
jgi:hypothetical protein